MPTPGRRAQSAGDEQELGRKPKKVNSEIRKQQNRIASRNYREKRKRKLQYLQQLVKDGDSSDQDVAQLSEHMQGQRVMTPEYIEQKPPGRPAMLPSNESYTTLPSNSSNMLNAMAITSTSPYDNSYRPSSQPLPSFEPTWPVSMYDPVPPVNISAWNVPQWMPSVDFAPAHMTPRVDAFQFTPPHSHHSYEDLSTPPQQSRTPDPDLFLLGNCRRHDASYYSNASLPSSTATSPFCHTRYTGGA